MVELITVYSPTKIPFITYEALDEYATSVVADFAPQRLKEPAPHDVFGFIRDYLGLNVVYYKLPHEKQVIGFTAFHGGVIHVVNERTSLIETAPVSGGTVIIDKSLTEERNVRRLRFTATHEGSHWLLHRKAFENDNPSGNIGAFNIRHLAAKTGTADYSRSKLEKTDKDRTERQADFLAAAILIPRPALRIAYCDFFHDICEKPRALVRGADPKDEYKAKRLTGYIANVFNVSNRAALIRLEKLNAIVSQGAGDIR
ncbi:MAG: ImmA/IrrE family metallo-endopeptidase [Clostridiales bacterium]|jgi:Zn-dependent peptidase ImmA (M78 family)|nr:ImmA/IrrE family metallo-endopeptidase [Clostridiales bacterium]